MFDEENVCDHVFHGLIDPLQLKNTRVPRRTSFKLTKSNVIYWRSFAERFDYFILILSDGNFLDTL